MRSIFGISADELEVDMVEVDAVLVAFVVVPVTTTVGMSIGREDPPPLL